MEPRTNDPAPQSPEPAPAPSDEEIVAELIGYESKTGDARVQALVDELLRDPSAGTSTDER